MGELELSTHCHMYVKIMHINEDLAASLPRHLKISDQLRFKPMQVMGFVRIVGPF